MPQERKTYYIFLVPSLKIVFCVGFEEKRIYYNNLYNNISYSNVYR